MFIDLFRYQAVEHSFQTRYNGVFFPPTLYFPVMVYYSFVCIYYSNIEVLYNILLQHAKAAHRVLNDNMYSH